MDIQTFLQISVVGAFLSVVMKFIKDKYGIGTATSKLLVIALSVILATLLIGIAHTPYYQTVLAILAAASTVYALIIKDLA